MINFGYLFNKQKTFNTFSGEIQVHVFEGDHYNIRSLENDAFYNIFLPGAYVGLWAVSVGCIQHQVTLEETIRIKLNIKYKAQKMKEKHEKGITGVAT